MGTSTRTGTDATRHVVVVGGGMVGHRFAKLAADVPGVSVTVFGEEPRSAYDRVHLSEYFTGKSADELSLPTPPKASVHVAEAVTEIDRAAQSVRSSRGRQASYDALVLATGSYPFVPPVEGRDLPHCHVYRTIEDLDGIRASGVQAKVGVVVGGGLLGLEAANALKNLGLATHVVERWSQPIAGSSAIGQRAFGNTAKPSRCPAASRRAPAWAIMAPLSVHSCGGG